MSEQSRFRATVYVGGLDQSATAQTVRDAFVPFGDIVDVSLPKPDHPAAKEPHRGFAYVEFESAADAEEAIDNMDRSELHGRILKVAPAKPPKDVNDGLNSKTAVWHQEGYLSRHAVTDEDRAAVEASRAPDPMQRLETLDVAGPRAD